MGPSIPTLMWAARPNDGGNCVCVVMRGKAMISDIQECVFKVTPFTDCIMGQRKDVQAKMNHIL